MNLISFSHPSGISAKVIAHSVSRMGQEILSFECRYPRPIHGEVMTHRVFGRNAASSRAIPTRKMLEQILTDPAGFVHIGKNQPGMQAHEEVSDEIKAQFLKERHELALITADYVRRWSDDYGIHKQVANRHIEPWQWMKTIITSTEWANFAELRCHPDAQPEFRVLAECMMTAKNASTPVLLRRADDWHLPYITAEERETLPLLDQIRCSVARCARVSYLTHGNERPDVHKDLALHDRLLGSVPMHASPSEHQACPDIKVGKVEGSPQLVWEQPWMHGNLVGWKQYRKYVERNQPIYVRKDRKAA